MVNLQLFNQYNSYTPTIGAGGIAAKTIRAEHLITDNVILYDTQIADGIIKTKPYI